VEAIFFKIFQDIFELIECKPHQGCWLTYSWQTGARSWLTAISQPAEALSSDSIQSTPFFIFFEKNRKFNIQKSCEYQ
jgi:hypothetical protein